MTRPATPTSTTGAPLVAATSAPSSVAVAGEPVLAVRVDQDLCTGDGLCVQYAPEVFEFDIDGLAYVKGEDGELLTSAGASVLAPAGCTRAVLDAAELCPGECIFVTSADGSVVAGPGAPGT